MVSSIRKKLFNFKFFNSSAKFKLEIIALQPRINKQVFGKAICTWVLPKAPAQCFAGGLSHFSAMVMLN